MSGEHNLNSLRLCIVLQQNEFDNMLTLHAHNETKNDSEKLTIMNNKIFGVVYLSKDFHHELP